MRKLSPHRIRELRESLQLTRPKFGQVLCAALTTVDQWEKGQCAPVGAHRRVLELLDLASSTPHFKRVVHGPPIPGSPSSAL